MLASGWAQSEPRTPGDCPLERGRLARFEIPYPRLRDPSLPKAQRSLPRRRSSAGLPSPESHAEEAAYVKNAGNQHFPSFLRLSGYVFLCEEARCHESHMGTADSCSGGFLQC